MPSQHYYGPNSTEDVFRFPSELRSVTRIIRDVEEVSEGVYRGWICYNSRKWIVEFIVDVDKHFRVISERKDHG